MPKKVAVGVVASDKMMRTRRVEIPRLVKHPMYGKIIRRATVCFVHDERNESSQGDTVEIIESRPRARKKRWELVRVIARHSAMEVAAEKVATEQTTEQGTEQTAEQGTATGDNEAPVEG